MADFKISQLGTVDSAVSGDFFIINKGNTNTSKINFSKVEEQFDSRYVRINPSSPTTLNGELTVTGNLTVGAEAVGKSLTVYSSPGESIELKSVGSNQSPAIVFGRTGGNDFTVGNLVGQFQIKKNDENMYMITDGHYFSVDDSIKCSLTADIFSVVVPTSFSGATNTFTKGIKVTGGGTGTANITYSDSEGIRIVDNEFWGMGVFGRTMWVGSPNSYKGPSTDVNISADNSKSMAIFIFKGPKTDEDTVSRGVNVQMGGASSGEIQGESLISYHATYDSASFDSNTAEQIKDKVCGFEATAMHFIPAEGSVRAFSCFNAAQGNKVFNYVADGTAPNFFKGDIHIGGELGTNSFQVWRNSLSEEERESLRAGTLAIPTNVSTPGDGSFIRQVYYNAQSPEVQSQLDDGTLDYPEAYRAENFTDTFALSDTTVTHLDKTGNGFFGGGVKVGGGTASQIKCGIISQNYPNQLNFVNAGESQLFINKYGGLFANFDINYEDHANYGGVGLSTKIITSRGAGEDMTGAGFNFSIKGFEAANGAKMEDIRGFSCSNYQANFASGSLVQAHGFYSELNLPSINDGRKVRNFVAEGSAPSFFRGGITQGGAVDMSTAPGYGNTTLGISSASTSSPHTLYVAVADAPAVRLSRSTNGTVVEWRYKGGSENSGSGAGKISIVSNLGSEFSCGETSKDSGFVSSSDYRLKENVAPLSGASDMVKLLNPVAFNYIGTDETVHGFIAHELQEVHESYATGTKDETEVIGTYTSVDGEVLTNTEEPQVVPAGASFEPTGTRAKYQGVDKSKLVPILTKALQEALEQIDDLKARVEALEGN